MSGSLSVGHKLLDEIERVSALRERYRQLVGMKGVNVNSTIMLMTMAINEAKRQVADQDPVGAIRALKELEGFTE